MKRILLLRPATDLQKTLPIGLLYLSTYLKKKLNNCVEIYIADLRLKSGFDRNEFYGAVSSFKPDIVGITSLSVEIDETLELARFVKEKFAGARLIIGGPLASSEHAYLAKLDLFDNIVVGEGEEVLSAIVEEHPAAKDMILYSNDFSEIDMNFTNFPDYSLIDLNTYFNLETHEAFQVNREAVPIFTSRGCPFNCGFCLHMFGKKVRFRSLENVIAEIEYLVNEYKIKEIQIEDDIFNIKKERVAKFFSMLNEKNIRLSISFPNGLKYDFLDEEIIILFKANGVYRVPLGIESVSDKIMDLISKRHNFRKLESAIQLLDKYNILTHGFFITGFPGEDIEDLRMSLDFINRSKLHTYRVSRYIPFKNTALYEKYYDNIDIDEKEKIRGANYYVTNINLSNIPDEVIEKELKLNNFKFYLNPIKLCRIFIAFNKKALMRNVYRMLYYFVIGVLPENRKTDQPATLK